MLLCCGFEDNWSLCAQATLLCPLQTLYVCYLSLLVRDRQHLWVCSDNSSQVWSPQSCFDSSVNSFTSSRHFVFEHPYNCTYSHCSELNLGGRISRAVCEDTGSWAGEREGNAAFFRGAGPFGWEQSPWKENKSENSRRLLRHRGGLNFGPFMLILGHKVAREYRK